MKELLNKLVSIVLLAVYAGSFVCASEIPSAMQKSQMRLEHYLDRAALERSEENWIETAERGLNEALLLWESENLTLKENESGWQEGRENAENIFKQSISAAYEKWLSDKLSEEIQGRVTAELKKRISQAAKERIANGLDPESAAAEQAEWNEKTNQIIEEYLSELESENSYTSSIFSQEFSESLKNDALLIAEKEGRMMLLEILYDQKSSKSLTEQDAAKAIAQEIAEETGTKTRQEMDRLFESLEVQVEKSGKEGEIAVTDDWVVKFKEEFNKGLSLWETAETEFLAKRSEWEKIANKTYLDGETEWQSAREILLQKRTEWEKSIEQKLKTAQEKFKSETEDYSRQINEALTEYAAVLEESSSRKQYLAQTESEVYNRARSLAVSAKEGVENWGVLWSERYRGLYSYWKTAVPDELNAILAANKNAGAKIFNVKNVNDETITKISAQLEDFKRKHISTTINLFNSKYSEVKRIEQEKLNYLNKQIKNYVKAKLPNGNGYYAYKSTDERLSLLSSDADVKRLCSDIKSFAESTFWESYSTTDSDEYIFDSWRYSIFCSMIDEACNLFIINRNYRKTLDEFQNIDKEINDYFDQNDYKSIQEYTERLYSTNLITNAVIIYEHDLNSCAELVNWLTTTKNSFEQAEQAQQILYELSISDGEFLSELEREIIKARAELESAREEKLIADALNEYASTTDWTRESSEITAQNLADAKAAYDRAFEEYELTAAGLDEYGNNIEKAQRDMDKALAELGEAQEEMEKARTAYDAAMASFIGVSCQTVSLQLVYLINCWKEAKETIAEKGAEYYKNINKDKLKKENDDFENTMKDYNTALEAKIIALQSIEQSVLKDGYAEALITGVTQDEKAAELARAVDEIYKTEFTAQEFDEESIAELITGDELLDEEIRQNAIAELEALNEENRTIFEEEKKESLAEAEKTLKERLKYLVRLEKIRSAGANENAEDYETLTEEYKTEISKLFTDEEGVIDEEELENAWKNIEEEIEAVYADGGENSRTAFDKRNKENLLKTIAIIEENAADPAQATAYSYDAVLEYAKEIKRAALKSGILYGAKAENYIRLYLEAEAYRHFALANSVGTETESVYSLKTKYSALLEELLPLSTKIDAGEAGEEEIRAASDLEIQIQFISALIIFTEEKDSDWAERLTEAGLCNEVNISESDRDGMSKILPVKTEKTLSDYEKRLAVLLNMMKDTSSASCTVDEAELLKYSEALEELASRTEQIKSSCEEYEQFKSADTIGNAAAKLAVYTQKQQETEEAELRYLAAAEKVQDACEAYNAKSEEIAEAYKALDDRRLEKRIAQTVSDWSQSVYLENMGVTEEENYLTPKERASKADFAYKKAQLSLAVLEEVLGKEESAELSFELDEALSAYKEADTKYYSSLVLRYEAEKTLNAKKAEVEAAETQAMNLRLSAVRGTCYEEESKLVYITKNEDGTYSFALRNGATQNEDNSAVQQEYLDTKTVEVNHVELETAEWYTQAEEDLYRWYNNMMKSGRTFEDVALAAMHVLAQKGLLYPNPYIDSSTNGYTTGIGDPHGIDADDRYLNYRKDALLNAYNSMMNAGRESDIAKYLFFAETSSSVFQQQNEAFYVQTMKERALDRLEDKMDDIKEDNTFIRRTRFFRWTIRNPKGYAAESAEDKACSLKKSARQAKDYSRNIMASSMNASETAFRDKTLRIEELNVMKYGSKEVPEGKVAKEILAEQIAILVKDSDCGITEKVADLTGVLTKDEYIDVYEALDEIEHNLLFARSDAWTALSAQSQKDNIKQNANAALYESAAHTGKIIDEATQKELKRLANLASDRTLSIQERRAAEKEYDELYSETVENEAELTARLKELAETTYGRGSYNSETLYDGLLAHHADYTNLDNRAEFLVDENRLEESYYQNAIGSYMEMTAGYEAEKNARLVASYRAELEESLNRLAGEKLDVIRQIEDTVQAAITQWDKAEAKIRVQYNSWKRDFLKEYKEKADEWASSYEKFAGDKQEWVNAMYLAGSGSADFNEISAEKAVKDAVARAGLVSEMTGDAVNAGNIVSETLALTSLESLMANFASLENRMDEKSMAILTKKSAGSGSTGIGDIAKANLAVRKVEKQLEENAALLAAYSVKEYLIEAGKNIAARIKQNNDGMANWEQNLVLDAGYTYSRNRIHRNATTGASLFAVHYSTQEVHPYQDFEATVPVVSVDVDGLTGLGANAVMLALNQIKGELAEFEKSIFGEQIETKGQTKEEKQEIENKKKRFEELKAIGYENLNVKRQDEYNHLAAALYTTEGGRFAEHTGKAPVWIDNRDPSRSRSHNIKVWGSGEIGEIMLDFEWNEMKEKQGWAEVALPMWDKKLWNGSGAPSLRAVADIATSVAAGVVGTAASIVGTPIMGAAVATALEAQTKLLFAGLDYGLGYKSSWEVGNELGKSMAMSALSNFGTAGISSLSQSAKISTTLGKVAVSTGGAAAMTVGTTAIQNFDFNGDFNTTSFLNSMKSAQTWGSAASAALTTTLNTKYVSGMSAESSKFYGGITGLGVSFAGQGAQYGMYALDSVANGHGLYTAYNNMGGLSLNVADLGVMLDMAGSAIGRNNSTGQSGLGEIAHLFKGQGIYEVNLGTDGMSGKLGTGGVNVTSGLYDFTKRMTDKAALNKYIAENGSAKGEAAYNAYVYGDWTQETTAARLASGKDTLEFVTDKNFTARTTQNGKGRLIEMKDTGNKYENAVQLGHEAYRDGTVRDAYSQKMETERAVIGHAGMAGRMLNDIKNKDITLSASTAVEGLLFNAGRIDLLKDRADNNYDSRADYWTLLSDGGLKEDQDGWLRDENGMYINSDGTKTATRTDKTIGADKVETGLLNILYSKKGYGGRYDNFTDNQKDVVQKLMHGAGLEMEAGDRYIAQWILDDGKTHTIKPSEYMYATGSTVATGLFIPIAEEYGQINYFGYGYNDRYQNYIMEKENFLIDTVNFTSLFNSYANNPSLLFGPDKDHSDNFHKGNDNATAIGTRLYSQFSGIATMLDTNTVWSDTFNTSGINVNFEIGYKFEDVFISTGLSYNTFHMDNINTNLNYGNYYPAGTYIGNSGTTGQSTGPHVHNELHTVNSNFYVNTNVQKQMLNMLNIPLLVSDKTTDNFSQWNTGMNFYSKTYKKIYLNTNNLWGKLK